MKKASLIFSLRSFRIFKTSLLFIFVLFEVVSTFTPSYSSRLPTNCRHRPYPLSFFHFSIRPNQYCLHTSNSLFLATERRVSCTNNISFLNSRRRCHSCLKRNTSVSKFLTTTDDIEHSCLDSRRRKFLFLTNSFILGFVASVKQVEARGLVQFPCPNGLANSYHFLRVGISLLEEEGRSQNACRRLS
jgi:hypothetical protein